MLDIEVNPVMEEFLPSLGVLLLTVAKRHLYIFVLLLERHTVAAVRLEYHFMCKLHIVILEKLFFDYLPL